MTAPNARGLVTAIPFGDEPIADSTQDLIERARLAGLLAEEIASLDASNGAVVAITGDWGSGKTSIMNMAAQQLRGDQRVAGFVEFKPLVAGSSGCE